MYVYLNPSDTTSSLDLLCNKMQLVIYPTSFHRSKVYPLGTSFQWAMGPWTTALESSIFMWLRWTTPYQTWKVIPMPLSHSQRLRENSAGKSQPSILPPWSGSFASRSQGKQWTTAPPLTPSSSHTVRNMCSFSVLKYYLFPRFAVC